MVHVSMTACRIEQRTSLRDDLTLRFVTYMPSQRENMLTIFTLIIYKINSLYSLIMVWCFSIVMSVRNCIKVLVVGPSMFTFPSYPKYIDGHMVRKHIESKCSS
jgi:hypothetical protein